MGRKIDQIIEGIDFIVRDNPDAIIVKHGRKKKVALIDRANGEVAIYDIKLKGLQIDSMPIRVFYDNVDICKDPPKHKGTELVYTDRNYIKIHPYLWSMTVEDAYTALVDIFEYIVNKIKLAEIDEWVLSVDVLAMNAKQAEAIKNRIKSLATVFEINVEFQYHE